MQLKKLNTGGKVNMTNKKTKIIIKHLWKYAIMIVLFVVGVFICRILWELSINSVYLALGVAAVFLIISAIFDVFALKDILKIFK